MKKGFTKRLTVSMLSLMMAAGIWQVNVRADEPDDTEISGVEITEDAGEEISEEEAEEVVVATEGNAEEGTEFEEDFGETDAEDDAMAMDESSDTYTITIQSNSGYINDDPDCKTCKIEVYKGDCMGLPKLFRWGYTVTGFRIKGTDTILSNDYYSENSVYNYVPTSNITLIAQWKPAYMVTVKYHDESNPDEIFGIVKGNSLEDSNYNMLWPVSQEKREFLGYTIEGDTSGRLYRKGDDQSVDGGLFTIVPTGDMVFDAVWAEAYTISVDGDGGYYYMGHKGNYLTIEGELMEYSLDVIQWNIAAGTDFVMGEHPDFGFFDEAAVHKTGYKFAGWKVEGEDKIYKFDEPIKIDSDKKIKAVWKKDGFVKKGSDWEYYKNGKLYTDTNKTLVSGTIKGKKDWYKVTNGKFDPNFVGIAQATNGKWYFVRNGVRDLTYTGVAQATNGIWYYVEKGVINRDFSGKLVQATNGKWYYINKGKPTKNFSGKIAQTTDGKWYYCTDGKPDLKFSGAIAQCTNGEWYYVTNGKIDRSYTGIAECMNERMYYVTKGKLDRTVSGTFTFRGQKYKVVKGVVMD